MYLLASLCCLAVFASAYPENRPRNHLSINQNNLAKLRSTPFGQKFLTDTPSLKSASLSDFGIYFYNRRNRNHPVVIMNNDVESVVNSGFFNSSARIISITHGWQNDHSSPVNTELLEAILDTHDVNIFISDWGSVANEDYITAESSIATIGQFLGDFFNKLVATYGISHKQITFIGHSLGAHIAGIAGNISEEKVDLIIGLDPALPLVTFYPDVQLDPSDAEFVHIIHTCVGYLGYYDPLGHADYYPNGGENFQPGCIMDLLGTCSHGRSHQYLADSIANSNQKYWAYKCEDYDTFKQKECFDNEISFMGTLEPDRRARGSYYLKTTGTAPYAIDFDPFQQ